MLELLTNLVFIFFSVLHKAVNDHLAVFRDLLCFYPSSVMETCCFILFHFHWEEDILDIAVIFRTSQLQELDLWCI